MYLKVYHLRKQRGISTTEDEILLPILVNLCASLFLRSSFTCVSLWGIGQHYMVSERVNTDMVKASGIEPGDLVLEIGPGTGSLTKALVDAGAHVIAVEKVASSCH